MSKKIYMVFFTNPEQVNSEAIFNSLSERMHLERDDYTTIVLAPQRPVDKEAALNLSPLLERLEDVKRMSELCLIKIKIIAEQSTTAEAAREAWKQTCPDAKFQSVLASMLMGEPDRQPSHMPAMQELAATL